jgi:hypothetical protein
MNLSSPNGGCVTALPLFAQPDGLAGAASLHPNGTATAASHQAPDLLSRFLSLYAFFEREICHTGGALPQQKSGNSTGGNGI